MKSIIQKTLLLSLLLAVGQVIYAQQPTNISLTQYLQQADRDGFVWQNVSRCAASSSGEPVEIFKVVQTPAKPAISAKKIMTLLQDKMVQTDWTIPAKGSLKLQILVKPDGTTCLTRIGKLDVADAPADKASEWLEAIGNWEPGQHMNTAIWYQAIVEISFRKSKIDAIKLN